MHQFLQVPQIGVAPRSPIAPKRICSALADSTHVLHFYSFTYAAKPYRPSHWHMRAVSPYS